METVVLDLKGFEIGILKEIVNHEGIPIYNIPHNLDEELKIYIHQYDQYRDLVETDSWTIECIRGNTKKIGKLKNGMLNKYQELIPAFIYSMIIRM